MGAMRSPLLILLALLAPLSGCWTSQPIEPASSDHMAYVENVALQEFQTRKTLNNLGKTVAEIYGIEPVIASRDQMFFAGPVDHTRLVVLHQPMTSGNSLKVLHGKETRLDLPLADNQKVVISPHGNTVIRYRGLDAHLGVAWLPDTETELFTVMGQKALVPREDAQRLVAALDDGTVILEDGPGQYRIFGSNNQVLAKVTLDDVHPSTTDKRGAPRSKTMYFPRQDMVVVKDYKGAANSKGKRSESGLRIFGLKDGKLRGTYPSGVKVIAGYDDPEHFMMLQKPGKLVFFEKGKPLREGKMPGRGTLSISPWSHYFTVTTADNRMWLGRTENMAMVWEHTSPEPWNQFIPEGTHVADNGTVFAMRNEADERKVAKQLQIFSIDSKGAGLVLLERPYQDALIPPVWMAGITDDGKQVALGAIGEEMRIVTLPRTPEPMPGSGPQEADKTAP